MVADGVVDGVVGRLVKSAPRSPRRKVEAIMAEEEVVEAIMAEAITAEATMAEVHVEAEATMAEAEAGEEEEALRVEFHRRC